MSFEKPKMVESAESTVKFVVEFQQKVFWDSANLLSKGFAFYLAIIAALLGYTLTRELPTALQRVALFMGLGTSLLGVLVAWICFWGLLRILATMERTIRNLDPELFQSMELPSFFFRWRSVVWTFTVGGTLVGSMFVTAIVILLRKFSG